MKTSESTRRSSHNTYMKYRAEHSARAKVAQALKDGTLVKRPCEICGDEKSYAHHDDYGKPLEVRWLCGTHHAEWHKENEPVRIPYVERTMYCSRCGKLFTPTEKATRYCSKECKYQAILENNRASAKRNGYKQTETYKRMKNNDPKYCKWCGKPFFAAQSKYCSEECAHNARLQQRREEYLRHKEQYRQRSKSYKERIRNENRTNR